jgi:sporulation protein YlmC with PRC-barrel domain
LPSSKIKGEKVTTEDGEDLGKIEDLMIDQEKGIIAYAVISFGGFLGIGIDNLLFHGKLLQRDKINTLSPSKSTRKSWKKQRALIRISCL